MFASARWLSRVACAMVLSACAESTDPIAPPAEAPEDPSLYIGSGEPTAAQLAMMPAEFAQRPTILNYWTEVGFLPTEGRAYARGFMDYFATDAEQEVTLDLRFENTTVGTTRAVGEQSNWLPWVRMMFTTAHIGVSGTCGHLADGSSRHRAWHKFLISGWEFLSWGNYVRSSHDSEEQPACPPPPPPPTDDPGGGDDEYEGDCELCQQWFYYIDGRIVDQWWECEPIDPSYCEDLMR